MKGKRLDLAYRDLLMWDQLYSRWRPRGPGVLLFKPDHIVIALPPGRDRRRVSNTVSVTDFEDEPYTLAEIYKLFEIRRVFGWVIDLDERGSFRAHVEDAGGSAVFRCSNEESEDGDLWLLVDGFMRNTDDTDGLSRYLRSVGLIGPMDVVWPSRRFNAYVQDLENRYLGKQPTSVRSSAHTAVV